MQSRIQFAKNSFLAQVVLFAMFGVAFILAILALPLATFILLLAKFERKRNPDGLQRSAARVLPMAEMVWVIAVMGAGMVVTLVVLPIGLFWSWISRKPLPPPPQYGSPS